METSNIIYCLITTKSGVLAQANNTSTLFKKLSKRNICFSEECIVYVDGTDGGSSVLCVAESSYVASRFVEHIKKKFLRADVYGQDYSSILKEEMKNFSCNLEPEKALNKETMEEELSNGALAMMEMAAAMAAKAVKGPEIKAARLIADQREKRYYAEKAIEEVNKLKKLAEEAKSKAKEVKEAAEGELSNEAIVMAEKAAAMAAEAVKGPQVTAARLVSEVWEKQYYAEKAVEELRSFKRVAEEAESNAKDARERYNAKRE